MYQTKSTKYKSKGFHRIVGWNVIKLEVLVKYDRIRTRCFQGHTLTIESVTIYIIFVWEDCQHTLSAATFFSLSQVLSIWEWTVDGETPVCSAELKASFGIQVKH